MVSPSMGNIHLPWADGKAATFVLTVDVPSLQIQRNRSLLKEVENKGQS